MTLSNQEIECLNWLESLDSAYIGEEEQEILEKRFPNVEFNLKGVTSIVEDGEIKTPVRDYIHALKYGKPLD